MNNDTANRQLVNIEAVAMRRKAEWMKEHRSSITIRERFDEFLPWMLIVLQASFFIVSAKHTIDMINRMAPGFGWAAAIGFEVGLIVCSWMIYKTSHAQKPLPFWWPTLEALLFLVVLGCNLAGSLDAVVRATELSDLSTAALVQAFGTLSLPDQMALILAVIVSLVVPIGSIVVGQGVAHQIIEHRDLGGPLEQRWREVEEEELRRALYAEWMRHMAIAEARKAADSAAAAYVHGRARTTRMIPAVAPKQLSAELVREPVRIAPTSRNGRNADARFVVRAYLKDNPDAQNMTVRELARTLGISKTIAAEEIAKWKQENED